MTTRVLCKATLLLLAAVTLGTVSQARALSSDRFQIVAISAPGSTTPDHREYYLLMDAPPSDAPKKVALMPMTEAVADAIENLREGVNVCEGKRFKAQIFELGNCVAQH